MTKLPLVVDMDGTLIYEDLVKDTFLAFIKQNPFNLFRTVIWSTRGWAHVKRNISQVISVDPTTLNYVTPLLEYMQIEKASGRYLVLATGSDISYAKSIADHVGLFDEIVASDGIISMVSENKAHALNTRFGVKGYVYAGNSNADIPVWKDASAAIAVNVSPRVYKKLTKFMQPEMVF